jgi:outer membrane receptor protein involved in Fe transport
MCTALLLALITVPSFAQSAAGSSAAAGAANSTQGGSGDDTVHLSPFQVNSTQNTGYLADYATPYKTKQQTIDIPQAITVVTRDMLDDIPGYDMSDIIIYAGGVPKYGNGETYQLRGSDTATVYPLLDGQIYTSPFLDASIVDSIDVIRGPAALLYPNSALSGVINKTSRRPQSIAMNSIDASITDYGLYRAQFYSTGPVGQMGDGQLDYLVIGGYQGGSS